LLEKRATVFLVTACVYEAIALTFPNKKLPPITVLASRYKWFLPVFVILLKLHVNSYKLNEDSRAV
jgi:hypothetical protein